MSEMYDRIEELCKNNYMDVTALCRELSIPRSSLSELKSGRAKSISADKVSKIADYFHVSASYITSGVPAKFKEHFIEPKQNEDIKALNRNIVKMYPDKPLDECVQAQIKVFECLYSSNLVAEGYSLKFISFEKYVALMLGQEHTKTTLPIEIYSALVELYGTDEGMKDGTSYVDLSQDISSKIIPFDKVELLKIALWKGYEDIVDDEMVEDVEDFAKLLAEKKKRKMESK